MAKDTMSTLLTVGLVGGAGYLAYEWWQGQQAASPAAPASTATTPTMPGSAPATPVTTSIGPSPPPVTPPATPPAPAGPSLDQIYASLVQAVVAGQAGGDTAVTGPASAPMANPDVWNWYLVNRTSSGIASGPDVTAAFPGVDRTAPMSGPTYWAGVSPIIGHQLGLSGLRGLGAFGFAFRGMGRWGLGDDSVTLSIPGQVPAPVDTTASDYAAIVASMAQSPNFDTNAGSYSTDPTTGQTVFMPAATPKATGVSTPMIVLGAGAALLLIGIGSGIRK